MNIDNIITNLKEMAIPYSKETIFFGLFGLPYWREAKWFADQLSNISGENKREQLIVLLFSLQFENKKENDVFVKKINETRNKLLNDSYCLPENSEKTLSSVFAESHEKSISDAILALEDTLLGDGSAISEVKQKKIRPKHAQKDWPGKVNNECIYKNKLKYKIQLELGNCFELTLD